MVSDHPEISVSSRNRPATPGQVVIASALVAEIRNTVLARRFRLHYLIGIENGLRARVKRNKKDTCLGDTRSLFQVVQAGTPDS